jgi:protein tyrosine/serine phosphatase
MSMNRASVGILVLSLALAIPARADVPMRVAGVPNFHRVNENLFRGGLPTEEGLRNLAKMGVTTVLDLRSLSEQKRHPEAAWAKAAGLRHVTVPMKGSETPCTEQIEACLAHIQRAGEKVYVHCKQGKDRTGTVIGVYRIRHDGWSNQKAYAEARAIGMHWYKFGYRSLVRSYLFTGIVPAEAASMQPTENASLPADAATTTSP